MATTNPDAYYLPRDEFMKAMQDEGATNKKDKQLLKKYPKIEAFSKKLVQNQNKLIAVN